MLFKNIKIRCINNYKNELTKNVIYDAISTVDNCWHFIKNNYGYTDWYHSVNDFEIVEDVGVYFMPDFEIVKENNMKIKIKCINNRGGLNFLTIDKIYYAEKIDSERYKIINDANKVSIYPMADFELVNNIFKKEDLNNCTLVKLKNKRLCIPLYKEFDNEVVLHDDLISRGGLVGLNSYDNDLKYNRNFAYSCYDIIAIKKYTTPIDVINLVKKQKEPESWDWVREEKSEKEIELENLISKLDSQLQSAKNELNRIKSK
jgi:hypothetical protein